MDTILVTVDSLRYDTVFEKNLSLPTLERLSANGIVYENAFTNAPYTADSFTSIFSGTHPWRYGTTVEGYESDRPHIVEPLSQAGYETGGFYANPYLGPSFQYDRGWDYYTEGNRNETGSATIDRLRRAFVEQVNRESMVFSTVKWAHRTLGEQLGIELEGRPYPSAETLTDAFIEWLGERKNSPVFGWIHYMDIHSPFYPHKGTVSEGMSQKEALRTFYSVNKRPTEATAEEVKRLQRLYHGEVQYFASELGRLLDDIDQKLSEDTTVVVASDHGEGFNEHGFCFHPKELYDELVQVPLVVNTPETTPGCVETPVSNVDLLPTILNACGLDAPIDCSGESLLNLKADRRFVYSQAIDSSIMKVMITDGRWKLIREVRDGGEELYDRTSDPDEIIDRREDETDIADRLSSQLDDHLSTMSLDEYSPSMREGVPDDVSKRLKELGYR